MLLLAAAVPAPDAAQPLLDALRVAPTPLQAAALETRIETIWHDAASPAVQLLVEHAMAARQHDVRAAAADLDAAVDLQPELADLWRLRAEAHLAGGDEAGAATDLAQALAREPRCFTALADLSRLAEQRHDPKRALAVWDRYLQVDPHAAGAQARRDRLEQLISGAPL